MHTRTRFRMAAALLIAVLLAITSHSSNAAAQQPTYTTEFDAHITVTAVGKSESVDGSGEVVGKSEWDSSFATDMVVYLYRKTRYVHGRPHRHHGEARLH